MVLLAPAVLGRALRRLHGRSLRRLGPNASRGVAVGVTLALALKLALLAGGPHSGFLACHRTPLAPPAGGSCERSYENPFSRGGATRIDRHIDFQPETWNLGFVNSLRFNFYPWIQGVPDRNRLPLAVTWRGEVERTSPWVARLTYVDEATLVVGGDTHPFPPNYGPPRTASVPVPAGRHAVTLSYGFDDGHRTGQPRPPFPAATVRLARERAQGGDAAVRAARPALAWRLAAAASDGLIGFALLSLVGLYAGLLTWHWWPFALAAGGPVALRHLGPPWLLPEWLALPFLTLLALIVAARPRPRALLASYFAVSLLSLWIAQEFVPAPHTVITRRGGSDYLTYESQARTMLDTWSLQGGEDVFYNAPLYRYVRFIQRLLLGDGDLLPFAAGLMTLYLAVLWTVGRLAAPGRLTVVRRGGIALVAFLILIVLATREPILFVLRPLSEPATWPALMAGFALLLACRTRRAWPVGAALAALAAAIRPNQGPAAAFLLLMFLLSAPRERWRAAVTAATVFLVVLALPLAHNLYYGRRFVPSTTSGADPATLPVTPGKLLSIGHDEDIRALVVAHLQETVALTRFRNPTLRLGLHGLKAAWLLAAGVVVARWRCVSGLARWLLLWPVAFLGIFLVYSPTSYYPRHIVAGYLAMGLAAAYVLSGRGWRRPPSLAPAGGEPYERRPVDAGRRRDRVVGALAWLEAPVARPVKAGHADGRGRA